MTLQQRIEELEGDLAEALDQQAATNQVLEVISRSSMNLQAVFEAVVENATRLCGADLGMIWRFDGERYRVAVAYGASPEFQKFLLLNPIPPGRGTLVGKVALEHHTVQILDVLADPDYEWHEGQKLAGYRTLLGVPMLREGVPIGVIVLQRNQVRPFSERQIELVTTFAAQGAIAIENARLLQELQTRTDDLARSVEELKALQEISQAVSSTLDLQQMLTTIVTDAVQLSDADAGSIYEFDDTSQEFRLRAAHGLSDEIIAEIHRLQLRLHNTTLGRATLIREPVQIANIAEEPPRPLREIMRRAGYLAMLAVPLLREDRIIGGLVVRRKRPGAFPQATVDLLERFASQSTLAIQNARLFQEIEAQRRQLEVASQHKTEFLASMSHELRTPLNAIIGFSEVLLERLFGDLHPKQDEYLRDILSSGQLLLELINEILDLSKVEAGRMELELGPVFLPTSLEHALTMVRERASHHRIALHLTIDPAIGMIEADERKVRQVVGNLLSNAVKFTPDGGRVEVTAGIDGEQVKIVVRDTGIGIAPEDQVAIFEAFQRARHGPVRRHEGTGLGLTLSKRLVDLHGGRIWLESEVGVGSTFTFTLPIRQVPAPMEEAVPVIDKLAPAHLEGSSPLVLILEDDPHAAELLTLHLSGAGFRVAVAQDGASGIELAHRIRPDAIILDILLPKLDGWKFLTRAKADPSIAAIPVIIVSMYDEPGKGFALGAADYLVKPVSKDVLLGAVRRVIPGSAETQSPVRVLAIDDDPVAVDLIEAVLKPEGYIVLKASGGEAGLALARQEPPALVILDLLMPDVDGFMVVDHLRADPVTAAIPIVVLTAKTVTPEEQERLKGRISHLVRKTEFGRADLVDLVRDFCHPRGL